MVVAIEWPFGAPNGRLGDGMRHRVQPRLLVVEDDGAVREALCAALTAEGYAVQDCPETRMLHGNQLDAVTGGRLPAVRTVCELEHITDGTSNTMFIA